MSGGIRYNVSSENVAVTAIQDLCELRPADDRPILLHGFQIGQSSDVGDAAEEMLRVEVRRGHTTSGSGGSAPTPAPLDPASPAAAFAAEVNNTTIASGGTTVLLWAGTVNVRTGELILFPPELLIKARESNTTLVVRLLAAPADSLSMSCTFFVEEL